MLSFGISRKKLDGYEGIDLEIDIVLVSFMGKWKKFGKVGYRGKVYNHQEIK